MDNLITELCKYYSDQAQELNSSICKEKTAKFPQFKPSNIKIDPSETFANISNILTQVVKLQHELQVLQNKKPKQGKSKMFIKQLQEQCDKMSTFSADSNAYKDYFVSNILA